ncbi:MAG: tetratricopeptide repeat protein, partial [Gammaproteobacteria bacterium]
ALKLDDYQQALHYFQESLARKRALNDTRGIAVTLVNIGHVFHQSGELKQAKFFFVEAMQALEHDPNSSPSARRRRLLHTEENLAQIEAEQGNIAGALARLRRIDHNYQAKDWQRDQQRIERVALALCVNADHPCASYWGQRTQARLKRDSWALDGPTITIFTEWLYRQHAFQQAKQWLHRGLALPHLTEDDRKHLLSLKAKMAEQQQDWQTAYRALKTASTIERQQLQAKHARSVQNLKSRLFIQAQNVKLAELESQRIRQDLALANSQMQVSLLAALLLLSVAGVILFMQRKKRLWLQQKLQLNEDLRQHESAYQALKEEHTVALSALDKQLTPQFIIGADWRIEKVNRAFIERYPMAKHWQEHHLAIVWPTLFTILSARSEDNEHDDIHVDCPAPTASPSSSSEARLSLLVSDCEGDALLVRVAEQAAGSAKVTSSPTQDDINTMRAILVDLLFTCVHAWERATGKDKVDLAEASGIWRITIDGGRLRTRSLDRYLSLNTMPKRPRWRAVVQTAHFVLAETRLSAAERQEIEHKLEKVLAEIKSRQLA